MNQHNLKGKQPCWTCTKYLGGCSWSARFEPVPGWKARKTVKGGKRSRVESYAIKHCPEYEEENYANRIC